MRVGFIVDFPWKSRVFPGYFRGRKKGSIDHKTRREDPIGSMYVYGSLSLEL